MIFLLILIDFIEIYIVVSRPAVPYIDSRQEAKKHGNKSCYSAKYISEQIFEDEIKKTVSRII